MTAAAMAATMAAAVARWWWPWWRWSGSGAIGAEDRHEVHALLRLDRRLLRLDLWPSRTSFVWTSLLFFSQCFPKYKKHLKNLLCKGTRAMQATNPDSDFSNTYRGGQPDLRTTLA